MSGLLSSLYLQKFKRLSEGNRNLSNRKVSSREDEESWATLKCIPVLGMEGSADNEKDGSSSVKKEV
jgi:hypothetical protein